MADLSGLPALDVNPIGFGADTNNRAAVSQLNQLAVQKAQALQPLEIEQQSKLIPLEIKEKQDASRLQEMQTANTTLAQVAKDAAAADPADAPRIWDEGMQAAAQRGVSAASQYIGHYRPDLAERVGDVYGGGAQGKGGSSSAATQSPQDQAAIERAVAGMPVAQVQTALGNLNRAITSFNNVKDQQSWEDELQALKEGGIDPSKFLPSLDWNPMNYATAARTIKSLVPYRDAMAGRAAILAAGGRAAEPTPLGTNTYIGTTPDKQLPVTLNTTTGKESVGDVPVGPKPSAATSTFMFKQKMAIDAGMTQAEALNFANGVKSLPPERLQEMALSEANKELGDASLAGAVIPDPDAWVRDKAAENYKLLTSSAVAAPGGGAGGGAGTTRTPPPASQLPKRAIDTLKAAGGKPVKFNNGFSYKWDSKTQRAVPVQ